MPLTIERIETACVAPRWGLLRITAQGGIHGFGEFTLEGQLAATEAAVHELGEQFIGQDASDLKRLVRGCYDRCFYHGGAHFMSALGGIEIALWDLAGKAAGMPIYRLLGGKVRDRVKVYRWAGGNNNAPEAAAEEAARVVSEGARALKMNACPPLAAIDTYGGIAAAVARASKVREAVGPEIEIAFDFHGRANVPMARRLAKELEFADPLFYEEPVRPDYNRWLPEIAAATHVPIATGERMTTVAEFSDVVAAKGAHILQPDLVHVGGISNAAEIAALAEANGIAFAPHCPLSPIAFMACLHVVAQSRAGWILEWSKGIHYNASQATATVDPWLRYLDENDWPQFDPDPDGHLPIPTSPGLGIRVDWVEVQRAAADKVLWRDEAMQLPDGARANWGGENWRQARVSTEGHACQCRNHHTVERRRNVDFIEQLKSSIDIVHVVGEYVRLKRQGAGPRYSGLCPFHSEKTPSFSVHSTHQFYKCFGCGAGGDAIKFVMEIERFTFWEAVKYLAERNGIPIPQRREFSDDESKLRQAIHEMHELAASAFRDLLLSPQGEPARDYLKRRGLSLETAAEFGLGLSDRSGQMLVRLFEKRGFSPVALEASGLVLKRNDGPGSFDRFRGRLMFPIHSESGQIIAFGGRALLPGEEPKYLNSSETAIYRKSQVLYNLNRARKSIQEKGYSILVEGYMDVIGVSAAGVPNVVATCGTALTNYQVRSLRRHAGMLYVNFDPDKAGVNATERSIPILLEEGMNLKVLTLSEGLDPDEYIQRNGVEAYVQALDNARGYFHWLADRAREKYDLYSPEGRVAAFQFLLPSIQKMPGRLERLSVATDVAEYLKLDQSTVLDEFRKAAADRRAAPTQKQAAVPPDANEVILIHALLEDPDARVEIPAELAKLEILERLRSRRILEALLRIIASGENPDYSKLEARLDEPDRILLHEMLFADDTLTRDYTTEHAVSALKSLHAAGRKAHVNDLRRKIAELSKEGKTSEAFELMRQLTEMERSARA